MVEKSFKAHISILNFVDLGEINKKVYQADLNRSLPGPVDGFKG